MSQEQMIDEIVSKYGRENDYSIWFERLCDNALYDNIILDAFVELMAM